MFSHSENLPDSPRSLTSTHSSSLIRAVLDQIAGRSTDGREVSVQAPPEQHLEPGDPPGEVAASQTEGEGTSSPPRGGRPKLSKSERRRHKYSVSLNDDEKEALERKAELLGLPVRVFMREASLGARMSVKGRGEVLHRLSRVGVKVNQIAKQLSSCGEVPELQMLEDILAEVRAIRDEL